MGAKERSARSGVASVCVWCSARTSQDVIRVSATPATRSIADLPGPPGLPGLGNAHQLRPSSLHARAEEWCGRYGPIFRFDLAQRRVVCVGDTQSINAMLRERPEGFRRWRELERNADESGMKGVFVAEGEEWRRQRRLAV